MRKKFKFWSAYYSPSADTFYFLDKPKKKQLENLYVCSIGNVITDDEPMDMGEWELTRCTTEDYILG